MGLKTLLAEKTFRNAILYQDSLLHPKHKLHICAKKNFRPTDFRVRPKITGLLRIV